jgi:hypothetical protein
VRRVWGCATALAALVTLVVAAAAPADARWHRVSTLSDDHHCVVNLRQAVATNHHGRALVAWTCSNGQSFPDAVTRIGARVRGADGRWHVLQWVSPRDGLADWPVVAMDSHGAGVVAFSTGGSGSAVWARRVRRDGHLGRLTFLGDGIASSVAMDARRNAVFAFTDVDTSIGYVSTWQPGRRPTTPVRLTTPDVTSTSQPFVAMNAAGSTAVAWGEGNFVYERDVHLDGSVGGVVTLTDVAAQAHAVQPFLDRHGDLAVTWADSDGAAAMRALVVRRSAAGVIAPPQVLSTGETSLAEYHAALARDGSLDVVWVHGSFEKAFVEHLSPAGVLGPRQLISRHAAYVTIAVSPDGPGVVSWGQFRPGVSTLVAYSSRISSNGNVGTRHRMPYTSSAPMAHLVRRRYLTPAVLVPGRVTALVGP